MQRNVLKLKAFYLVKDDTGLYRFPELSTRFILIAKGIIEVFLTATLSPFKGFTVFPRLSLTTLQLKLN